MGDTKEKILIQTTGLPRSGKSTWSKKTGIPTVSVDDIRKSIGVYPYNSSTEKMVWTIAHYMVNTLIETHNVIILDACNHTEYRRKEWRSSKWNCKYMCFDTHKEICIHRAKDTNQEYLIPVIERMDKELVFPTSDCITPEQLEEMILDRCRDALEGTSYCVSEIYPY